MANGLDTILQSILGGGARTASEPVALSEGSPSTFAQLFTGAPKEGSFWGTSAGKGIGSLLAALGTGGLGALLGTIASPGARGVGAARGAALGTGFGGLLDIGQRRAAAEIPTNMAKQQAKKDELMMKKDELTAKKEHWNRMDNKPDKKTAAEIEREEWDNFLKTYKQKHPDGSVDKFKALAWTKYPNIINKIEDDEITKIYGQLMGSPYKKGVIWDDQETPGIYEDQNVGVGTIKTAANGKQYKMIGPDQWIEVTQ